ncbi:trypsin-3 [Anabrus simplex]|uniref:trypsin-3 n=1 Tax=Anabrus simplex TaxID=316456 RepID=UPI0035A27760
MTLCETFKSGISSNFCAVFVREITSANMFSMILSVVLLAVYLGIAENHASQLDGRIYGGEQVSSNENYLVFLESFDCSCAILSEEWMLASSNCLYNETWESGQTVVIPEIGSSTLIYMRDLVLIKLSKPFPDVQMGVRKAIALPDLNEDLDLGNYAEATIFGPFIKGSEVEMHKMNMSLEIGEVCKWFYRITYAQEFYICVEFTEAKSTCEYDEGALMVVDGKLVGLANRMLAEIQTCPTAATYQTFVKISAFRHWIHEITNL